MNKIFICLALTAIIIACKKTELPVQQEQEFATTTEGNNLNKNLTVTTLPVTPSSAIQATVRGNVSLNGGGNSIVEFGFCYSTSPAPTIASDTIHALPVWINDNPIAATFSRLITGLTAGITYYVKAYGIKNNGDIYYGNEISFTTLTLGMPSPGIGTVTDIDGNIYNTITLGTQVWMVENLKTTRYRDGTSIPNVTDNSAWASATSGAYCNYNNDPSNGDVYGRLYNYYAIKDTRMIAPAGWHVPTFFEWSTLIKYLGGTNVAGGRMKEAGFSHWLSPNTAADNSSGFTAVGSGFRFDHNGAFSGLNTRCRMWTSYELADNIVLDNNSAGYFISCTTGCGFNQQQYGFSIRCIKD
jgi:uncharacterized protein (TIGR02145 family)